MNDGRTWLTVVLNSNTMNPITPKMTNLAKKAVKTLPVTTITASLRCNKRMLQMIQRVISIYVKYYLKLLLWNQIWTFQHSLKNEYFLKKRLPNDNQLKMTWVFGTSRHPIFTSFRMTAIFEIMRNIVISTLSSIFVLSSRKAGSSAGSVGRAI